jgi:adenine phosphoribosyltransferase
MQIQQITDLIRVVPNFPKPGVAFKDITPILENAKAFQGLIARLAERVHPSTQKLVAIESRGFILGSAVAQQLGCGLVIVRKPGKLPGETVRESYSLEYGTDAIEVHKSSLAAGDKVTIIDDVLATGGTAAAAERLCKRLGAQVLGSVFFIELGFLSGRKKLSAPVESLLIE